MWIALILQELDNCKVLLAFYHFLLFLFRDASCLWRIMVLGSFFSLKCHSGDSEIIPGLHCHVIIFSCVWSMWSPLTQISAGSMKHPSCLQTGWSQTKLLEVLRVLMLIARSWYLSPFVFDWEVLHRADMVVKARTDSCGSVALCRNWSFDSTGPGAFFS